MDKTVEGAHTGFLCQIMGKPAQWNMGGTWVKPAAGEVKEAEGMNLAAI